MKKLFPIGPNQTKIPTDSLTWLTYRFVLRLGIVKKLLGIVVLGLLLSGNVYAEWLVIVKNKIDENIFIKRTKTTEEEAVKAALKGCRILYLHRVEGSSMKAAKKKKMLELMEACYVFSVIEQ